MNKLAEKISKEIIKTASKTGRDNGEFEKDYLDVELVINGEKKVCYVNVIAEFEFDWYYEEDTYWEPGERKVESLDIWINEIGIEGKDGTIYTKEQEDKILEDNRAYLEDLIEDDVETKAYEMEWETW